MDYVAIDVGARECQICVRGPDGSILQEERMATQAVQRWLNSRSPSRIVLETCAESFCLADQARSAGHQVRVVPGTLSRSLGVGARRIKTDRRDAQVLSEVLCRIDLPSVHIPSHASRELKTLCGTRDALVACRTKLTNTVRGWLRTQALRVRSGAANTFTQRVRDRLGQDDTPSAPSSIDRQLTAIDALSAQVHEATAELRTVCMQSELCRRLITVPGIGPITAVRFVAAVDEIGRFRSAHALQSYLGLTPGEHSSGDHKRRQSITKAGPRALRWLLVQAAWSARRTKTADPMLLWARNIAERRGTRIATVALARKLAGVMYALWRDGTSYNPTHSLP